MYTPRHSAIRFRRIQRQQARRQRFLAAIKLFGMGIVGGLLFGLLVGLMFVV